MEIFSVTTNSTKQPTDSGPLETHALASRGNNTFITHCLRGCCDSMREQIEPHGATLFTRNISCNIYLRIRPTVVSLNRINQQWCQCLLR